MSLSKMRMSQTGQTWLSSLDLKEKFRRRTSASNHGAVVIRSPTSPVSSQDPNWYKRIACCHLESGRGIGQGVLVDLNQFSEALGLGENLQLGLLTNHHIIPRKCHIVGWKLHIGPQGNKKTFALNDSMFTHCFSCCGPDGIWGREPHFQQSDNDPPTSCPVGMDFSLLILAQSFASELGSKLSQKDNPLLVFPPLHAPEKEEYRCMKFCILQRDLESGSIAPGPITLQSIAPPADDSSLEREVIAYKELCILRYQHGWITKIGKGSSGSGIFYHDEGSGDITLAGIHVSSEVDDGQMHYGLTVHAIVHSVAGGPTCGIIPALSLLKDASMRNCLAIRWYENLQTCLNAEEINLDQSLKVVDFLLKAEPSIFISTLGNPAVLPSLRLLTVLFGYFSKFESSKIFQVAERVLTTDGKLALFQRVQVLCNEVHNLLKEANQQNNKDVVEACFQCCYDMLRFGAPVYEVLYDSAKISSLRSIRDDKKHEDCVAVHRTFGNIFMAYEAYKRDSEQRKFLKELQEQAQRFDDEKAVLEKKAQQHAVEMQQEIKECKHQLAEEREQGADLDRQCQDQEQQLAEERKRGEDLGQQFQDQKQQLAEQRKRGEDLDRQFQDQKQQLAEERMRREELEQKLQEKEQELAVEKRRGEDSQQQLEQRYQNEREKHDQEMLQTTLALQMLQAEKQRLDEENERQAKEIIENERQLENQIQEIQQLQMQLQQGGFPHRSSLPAIFPSTSLYPTRKGTPSFVVPDSQKAFWDRNMATLLKADVGVRTKVGELFCKVQGASSGADWEHLLDSLELKMDASKLESQPPGDIILQIVQFWEKKESVTVRRFCEISRDIGIDSVARVLQEAEHYDLCTSLHDSSLDSEPQNV